MRTAAGALVAALLLVAVPAGAVPPGSTVLVDRPSGFGALPFDGVSDAHTGPHALSADGRYVAFTSESDVLLDGDDDSAGGVFRLDLLTGELLQVNTTADGGQPPFGSFGADASISADGSRVAFTLIGGGYVPGGPDRGVYVKDLSTGAVELASRATGADGAAAANPSGVISGDGKHVLFREFNGLQADNGAGPARDLNLYVRDLGADTTHLVSTAADGTPGGGVTGAFDIDFDGSAVAFSSSNALTAADTDADEDAYVHAGIGTATEATRLVSVTAQGQAAGAGEARDAAISGDGRLVAWGGFGAVFAAPVEPQVGLATRVSVAGDGTAAGGFAPAFEPVATAAARPARLDFLSGDALVAADGGKTDDLYSADLTRLGDGAGIRLETSGSLRAGGLSHAAAAGDAGSAPGRVVVFTAADPGLPGGALGTPQVYRRVDGHDVDISQPAGVEPRVSAVGDSFVNALHSVSDDGRRVVFETRGGGLAGQPPGTSQWTQVLVRDVASGETTLVSAAADGTPADGESRPAGIDAAGSKVAFLSDAPSLLGAGATRGRAHVYVRDLSGGAPVLVDRTPAGTPLQSGVRDAMLSADGAHLAYVSASPDAPGAPDGSNTTHVYVVDLASGQTELVDRAAGPAGAVADEGEGRRTFGGLVDISGDGSSVAFLSAATNLGAGDPLGTNQVYVRNRLTATTTWASVPEHGDPRDAEATALSLSRDGRRVAFEQIAPGFGYGNPGDLQIFVRDLATGSTTLGAIRPDGGPLLFAEDPSLSADGARLAFIGVRGVSGGGAGQAFVRDLSAPTSTLVSARPDGGPARFSVHVTSISGNGACVAFETPSADLVSPSYGWDREHVFLRAVSGECPAPPVPVPAVVADRTAPRITKARLTYRRFAVASGRTATSAATRRRPSARRGTTITFRLSEDAQTTVTISRRSSGRRSGKRCVKPRRGLKRRCTRVAAVLTLKRSRTRAGANRVPFTGRTARRSLKPGSYQARLVARDRAGNRSRPVTLRFTVVR